MSSTLATYFAPPEREAPDVLARQQQSLLFDPLVDRLLESIPEPTVVLNSRRQIIRANPQIQALLRTPQDGMLGLRLGEAIGCPHSLEKPAGCGTTPACRYCGAAQAIARSMTAHVMDVRECHVESTLSGEPVSLDLRVSAAPFDCRAESFTVCVLRDITDEKRRQVLEHVFFDDILQMASTLKGMLDVPGRDRGVEGNAINQAVRSLAGQVVEEIQSQQDLISAEAGQLAVRLVDVHVADLLHRLCAHWRDCAVCDGKSIVLAPIENEPVIWTDEALLGRVLGNLIKNALEASDPGQTITVAFEHRRHPLFSIHNASILSEAAQLQMFQRSFSTREGPGRGIGTYSARLFTERYLKGDVSFTSRDPEGTTFFVALPSTPITSFPGLSFISPGQ